MRKAPRAGSGHNLLEMIIATFIFSTVLLGLTSVWMQHSRVMERAGGRLVGQFLANQLMEECIAAGYDLVSNLATNPASPPEPLELSVSDAAAILRDNGVEEEKILAFRDSCATQFGDGATLNPANLIDSSRFEVKTADATISVDPEHSYLVEARIIDGRKYLLIPADEDIEVNGFGVRVKGE